MEERAVRGGLPNAFDHRVRQRRQFRFVLELLDKTTTGASEELGPVHAMSRSDPLEVFEVAVGNRDRGLHGLSITSHTGVVHHWRNEPARGGRVHSPT